ncbi:plasmid mobilization relaxosome protein MobC [Galliscardovia ingluviei]|uniref:plasmid mobilization relaxosome protein MobC n=1 Tax=Galliscardovia ingluviei TaxID=1769422 RepID=UPI00166D9076|nr:plasmid mobilization relaxosome protein MobC [Galliscardovia ingluviei]
MIQIQTLVNTDEYYRMFHGIGTNINQIAHKVNADNTVTVEQLQAVQAQLGELKTMFNEWATMWRNAQGN